MSNYPITLSSFLAVRDVEDYIEEWLNFYLIQGVQKFIIYDYASKDNTPDLIKPYMDRGIVEYSYYTEEYLEEYKHIERWFETLSLAHRFDAIEKYKDEHKWMCFFDLDEFVFPTNEGQPDKYWDNLKTWLEKDRLYDNFPGIAINWTIFGDSGEKTKKDDYVISRFNRRASLDYHVHDHCKVICRPCEVDLDHWRDDAFGRSAPNPHFFYYNGDNNAVNENYCIATIPMTINETYYDFHPAFSAYPENCTTIRCNHYMVKSLEEYAEKSSRHEALRNINYAESAEQLKDYNTHEDNLIKKYIPLLKSINLDNYKI